MKQGVSEKENGLRNKIMASKKKAFEKKKRASGRRSFCSQAVPVGVA
ncbi:MAG: hypothetical protein IJG86_09795 [Clostridia bacterium]|nr:hypothetical protein [Clostridia bacterium]